MDKKLKFALAGAGFWSRYQLAGWRELDDVECVAIYNRTLTKAKELADEFAIPRVYDNMQELLDFEKLDFLDIVTDVGTHAPLVKLAAERKLNVVTQKPMATTLAEAENMMAVCAKAGVHLFVHENWRWQTPIRELKKVLDSGRIGEVFRSGVDMISGFPVFQNQPFLAELPQFILTDLGSHLFDTARFLFGEASSLYCRTGKAHASIKGEDHATTLLTMGERGIPVMVRMSYAENYVRQECFPQTLFFVEGTKGSVELLPGYQMVVTTSEGTRTITVPPPFYTWADPRYAVVHSSVVACNADLLKGLRGGNSETNGDDNLKTVKLVFGAYASANNGSLWKPS